MRIKPIFITFALSVLLSCSYDAYIARKSIRKTRNVDFESITSNIQISYRSAGKWNTTICLLDKYENERPAHYFIEYNFITNQVIDINNELVLSIKNKDTFSKEDILNAMEVYMKLNFHIFSIDKEHNIYLYPRSWSNTMLFKKGKNTFVIPDGFIYFKDDWYIRVN